MRVMISPYVYPLLNSISKDEKSKVSYKDVVNIVCTSCRISEDAISVRNRDNFRVEARQIAWYVMKKKVRPFNLRLAGVEVGGYDHTTVMHGLRHIKDRIDTEPEIRRQVFDILNKMK